MRCLPRRSRGATRVTKTTTKRHPTRLPTPLALLLPRAKVLTNEDVNLSNMTWTMATTLRDAFDLDTDAQNLLSEIDALQETLTAEQLDAIKSMDMSELDMMTDELMSSDDIADALRKVPGLSEDQIQAMVKLEESLESNESIRKAVAPPDVNEVSEVDELLASDEGLRKAFEAGDKKQMEIELERLLGEGKMG